MSEADRYRLGTLRDARSRDERVTRGELAATASETRASQARVDAAATRIEVARTALAEARRARLELIAHGTTSTAMVHADRFVTRRLRELDAVRDAHARAVAAHRGQLDAMDAARDKLARARADRELIERHFARWRADKQKLAERRED